MENFAFANEIGEVTKVTDKEKRKLHKGRVNSLFYLIAVSLKECNIFSLTLLGKYEK